MENKANLSAKYFEDGCLCHLSGMIEKAPINHPNPEQYYKDHCTCSRHPDSHLRECWDRNKQKREDVLAKIKRNFKNEK